MRTLRAGIISFFWCLVLASVAEAASASVTVAARAIPSKITLGDEIRLIIQVERPKTFSVIPPTNKLDVSPFEVKNIEVSPVWMGKNRVRQTFAITLTVFQLGELNIPPVRIRFQNAQGEEDSTFTSSIPVTVVGVAKKASDKDDIRPIKDPVALDVLWIRSFILGALAFGLSIFLIFKIVRRLRKRAFLDPESLKPPHERALLELGRLNAGSFLEEKKTKEFYSELSNILRRYLERQYQMEALELTTDELLLVLKQKSFDRSLVEKVKEILQSSDLVKFAKLEPPRSQADLLMESVRGFVEETKPAPEADQKK